MAISSRHYAILEAIKATCNNDSDLAVRAFKTRKKPYNRGATWLAGGFVTAMRMTSPYHENQGDELIYQCRVTIVDPKDSDLTDGMASHMAAIERVQEIFRRKAHGFMPTTMRALNTTFATAVTAGSYADSTIQATDCEMDQLFVDPAFEAGFDASSAIITVRVTVNRYDSTAL